MVYNCFMTKINIQHIANLANLPIPEEKLKKLEDQLEETLLHVDRLQEIDTSEISGTNEVTNLTNVTRNDVITPSLTQEEALHNAKKIHNGFFVVPVIIEEAIE